MGMGPGIGIVPEAWTLRRVRIGRGSDLLDESEASIWTGAQDRAGGAGLTWETS